MKKSIIPTLTDEVVNNIIYGAVCVALCILCYTYAHQNIKAIWDFILKYLGLMGYILVPMTILLISILIHALFEPLHETSGWARVSRRFETFFPLVGLLSTFLAIAMGLADLNPDQMGTHSILAIAGEICKATWGSIVGVFMGMIAHTVNNDLTVKDPEPVADLGTQPVTEQVSQERVVQTPVQESAAEPSRYVTIIPNKCESVT